jgi:hypothetical protein
MDTNHNAKRTSNDERLSFLLLLLVPMKKYLWDVDIHSDNHVHYNKYLSSVQ